MWLPVMTGGRLLLRPGRRMNTLPIWSTVMLRPASRAQPTTRSRPWRSSSVRARRHTPPLSVPPMRARVIRLSQRRSPLMRRASVWGGRSFGFMGGTPWGSTGHSGGFGQGGLAAQGVKSGAEGRALQVAAAAALDAQIALHIDQATLADGVAGHAGDGLALEDVVVAQRVLGLDRQGLGGAGVPDHQIGIGAGGHAALARVQVEQLGRIGR